MPQQQQTQPQPSPTPPKKKTIRVPRVVNGVEQMVEIEVDDVAGPTWGPNDKHTLLNHRLTRVDGPLKVSGAARYTYDVRLPGMLYARVRRCPHAHAPCATIDPPLLPVQGQHAVACHYVNDAAHGSNTAQPVAQAE